MLTEPIVRTALEEALAFLTAATTEQLGLDEAKYRFRETRGRHAGIEMELLWEHERYTGAVSYDVLLRPLAGGTVSLGFSADDGVPWLLRSACHSHECDVAMVNSRLIDIQTVVAYMDIVWSDTRLLDQMIEDQLIDEAVEQFGLEPSSADVEQAMNEFRAANGLHSAADTTRWMQARGINQERLEWSVSRDAAAALLRRHVVDDEQVVAHLERDATPFDTVHIARIRLRDAGRAREILTAIQGGALDFFEVAQRSFVAAAPAASRTDRAFFAVLARGSLSPAQAALLFNAQPGDTVGPVPSGTGVDVVRVLAITRARANDGAARERARAALFAEWLADRRARARVEWFWGNAGKSQSNNSHR
jgi:putative peptide maturation system protein